MSNPMRAAAETPSAQAYPTLTAAAGMAGVSPPTLSRQKGLEYIRAGARDHRVPAKEVVRLTYHFRRRSLDEVAFELVEYARAHAPESADVVAAEVDDAVAAIYQATPSPSVAKFLGDARRFLPEQLYVQVAKAMFDSAATASAPTTSRSTDPVSVASRLIPVREIAVARKAAAARGRSPRRTPKPKGRKRV